MSQRPLGRMRQASKPIASDTYDTTILFDHETDRLQITSYGGWIERYGDRREVV